MPHFAFTTEISIDSLHHGGAVIWHISFIIYDQMQSRYIHLLQSQPVPVIIQPLADGHGGTRCCSGGLCPKADAYPVTAIMLLKVSRNTPDKVKDATANTDMRVWTVTSQSIPF